MVNGLGRVQCYCCCSCESIYSVPSYNVIPRCSSLLTSDSTNCYHLPNAIKWRRWIIPSGRDSLPCLVILARRCGGCHAKNTPRLAQIRMVRATAHNQFCMWQLYHCVLSAYQCSPRPCSHHGSKPVLTTGQILARKESLRLGLANTNPTPGPEPPVNFRCDHPYPPGAVVVFS